jgi:peptidoglycan/LPS O-acetylase OafA/YrhL
MTNRSPRKFLHSVEFLRGVAALSVTWFHLTNTYPENWVKNSGYYGWMGVEVFFIISGFIIPSSLFSANYTSNAFWRFMARRMIRLEPPYLLSILFVVILTYLSASMPGFKGEVPSFSIIQIMSHFFYLIPLTNYTWISVVYWTLAYEFGFYVFVGITYSALIKAMPISSHLSTILLFCIFALIFEPVSQFLLFALGILSFRFFVKIDDASRYIAAIVIISVTITYLSGSLYLFVVLTATAILIFLQVPQIGVFSFLGSISYSLYLLHVPIGGRVVNLGRRFCDSSSCEFPLSVLALLICLVSATIYSRLVERPAQRASKTVAID